MVRAEDRQKIIARTSCVSIVTNLILVAVKGAVGFFSGSVSIMNDAVNNAGDSISALLTMGFYSLSRKRPTKKHPLGYGRMEYLSGLIVALLIIITGVQCRTVNTCQGLPVKTKHQGGKESRLGCAHGNGKGCAVRCARKLNDTSFCPAFSVHSSPR